MSVNVVSMEHKINVEAEGYQSQRSRR